MPEWTPFSSVDFTNGSIYLELIDDTAEKDSEKVTYHEITQFSANFAVNEIPQATCALAVGRDATSENSAKLASIHKKANAQQMIKARVYGSPKSMGGMNIFGGKNFNGKTLVLFDGYLAGLSRTKLRGKFTIVASLIHWLYDLACSSILSAQTHPGNAESYIVPLLIGEGPVAGVTASGYTTQAIIQASVSDLTGLVMEDIWSGIKSVFTYFAQAEVPLPFGAECQVPAAVESTLNSRALAALAKMEGPIDAQLDAKLVGRNIGPISLDYKYGVPVTPNVGVVSGYFAQQITENGIANELVASMGSSTFWDKLVGQYCPNFGLCVIPMIDRAAVVADTPMLSRADGKPWAEIYPEDYFSETFSGALERPLRGVAVAANNQQGTLVTNTAGIIAGGCHFAEDIQDGTYLIIAPPSWLLPLQGDAQSGGTVHNTMFDIGIVNAAAGAVNSDLQKFYGAWAKDTYMRNTLRGRTASVSGRFRLDIAPGSIVRIQTNTDTTRNKGQDTAGDDMVFATYGCVSRMSIYISAEAPHAGCTYQLSHVRTETEYANLQRTGTRTHPLYGSNIHGRGLHGSALLTDAETDEFYFGE